MADDSVKPQADHEAGHNRQGRRITRGTLVPHPLPPKLSGAVFGDTCHAAGGQGTYGAAGTGSAWLDLGLGDAGYASVSRYEPLTGGKMGRRVWCLKGVVVSQLKGGYPMEVVACTASTQFQGHICHDVGPFPLGKNPKQPFDGVFKPELVYPRCGAWLLSIKIF